MFSALNYSKLKTNLRLAINRLKLIGKKKTELTQKSRKEIADYISANKEDRARIKVEQIIREDYYVEAFELLEMFCDLLLARFGLIEQMKTIDKGLEEAINSIMWAAPRLQTEIPELKVISDQITFKYGKPYAEACRENKFEKVNEKLLHKLSVLTPPKVLVEKYMVEIAKSHNVPFIPDANVVMSEQAANAEALLIDYQQQGGNKVAEKSQPTVGGPSAPKQGETTPLGFDRVDRNPSPFNYPPPSSTSEMTDSGYQQPFNYPHLSKNPSEEEKTGPPPDGPPPPPPYTTLPPNFDVDSIPSPPSDTLSGGVSGRNNENRPPPPVGGNRNQNNDDDDFDFDDLNRRFEELKKKR